MGQDPKTFDVLVKGKSIQLVFKYEDETACDIVVTIPLKKAVILYRKIDGAIRKVMEDFHRI